MAEITVRGATLELRSFKLTRALLKQFRKLTTLPGKFKVDPLSPDERALFSSMSEDTNLDAAARARFNELQLKLNRSSTRLNPATCVGWLDGSVLGDEYTSYVLFVADGDAYLFNWPGFKPEPWCKQIYV